MSASPLGHSVQSTRDVLQSFLADAVARGTAPGYQAVVFDRDSILFNGVSGFAHLPSKDTPEGVPYKPETIGWLASASKISTSLLTLHIIDRGLAKSPSGRPFTFADLDDPEALADILPEFKPDSGSLVTKVIVGFEDQLGADGKKVMKLRDARNRVTLRHLLTHTAGMAYWWTHPLMAELYRPSDGSVPHNTFPFITGDIRDFTVPLVSDPGTTVNYGPSTDWLGQFSVRSTGQNLRRLFKNVIFDPLGLPASEVDIYVDPEHLATRAGTHVRVPDAPPGQPAFMEMPLVPWMCEGDPPEGKAAFAGACVYASAQTYAKVLQAVLKQDTRLLSAETWKMAVADDLGPRGVELPKPLYKTAIPENSYDCIEFEKSTVDSHGAGMNLLQCIVAKAPTVPGHPPGTYGWAGILNSYYFIDPVNGVGALISTQMMPFLEPQVVETRDRFAALIYKTLLGTGADRSSDSVDQTQQTGIIATLKSLLNRPWVAPS